MSETLSSVPTVECRRCEVDVPAGNFCGLCGTPPEAEPGKSSVWLRRRVFGPAPSETVLRPYLTSSLFPQMPSGSRMPFQLAIVIAGVALMLSAVLRLPSLGITVGALGLPVLFVVYLRSSGADRDMPWLSLAAAALLGALLGAVWVLLSGEAVARHYGVPMVIGLALHHLVRAGFVIPAVGMGLMVVPPVLIRLSTANRSGRESLDGFMIGALTALFFSGAATLTRLAPQINTGLVAHARPVKSLVVEAVLCGVSVPISAAAAGGMVGIALWFTPRGPHQDRVRAVLFLLAAGALLIHGAVGVLDIVGVPQVPMAVAHITITALVLIGLRLSQQLALLHESTDPVHDDRPLLCTHCQHVVPDMPFCSACGAASRASSQQSRRERRGQDPVTVPERSYPGYALPSTAYLAPEVPKPRLGWLMGRWGVPVMAVAVVLGGLALAFTPKIAHYMCPPDCGKPPSGMPVMALPRYTAPDGRFSVAYPAPGPYYTVDTTTSGVTATLIAGDGGVLQLFSEPAKGRSAKEVGAAILKKTYPDAKVEYDIPNAMVGYQPGYGVVADDWPQGATTSYSRQRIVVMSAVKNDLALVAFAAGPYHAFGPDFGPGQPSGANLQIAQDMGKYVNSFQWSGDPSR